MKKILAFLCSMFLVVAGIVATLIKDNEKLPRWVYLILFAFSSIVIVYPSVMYWYK